MHVFHIFTASLDVMVDGVRGHGANLHQPVVLNEDSVACQVSMNDRWCTAVEITVNSVQNVQSTDTPGSYLKLYISLY